jgi:hypothetical protein
MNTTSIPPTSTRAQRAATQTRRRRHAAGKYPTPAQKAAFTRRLSAGLAALTQDELAALSTHPHLTHGQRQEYAALAAQAAHDADTADYEDDILDREYHARGGW